MSRKLALVVAPLLGLTLFALLLAAPSRVRGASPGQRVAPITHEVKAPASPTAPDGAPTTFLSQGFEGAVFAPEGWQVITLNQKVTATWQALTGAEYAHSGQRGAVVLGDVEEQDEKLLTSPVLVPDGDVEVAFWAKVPDVGAFSSFADDVELWLVRGEPDFDSVNGDDYRLKRRFIGSQIVEDGVWTEIRHSLSLYHGEIVRLAWRYVAQDAGDFYLDDVRVERLEPLFDPPHNYVAAPYKIELGQWMTYVLVISNTGSLTGTEVRIADTYPGGVSHVAGTAQVASIGAGVVAETYVDVSDHLEWTGIIPTATGLLITIPVRVVGDPGLLLNNSVEIIDPDMVDVVLLEAETRIQPPGTLFYYESFNQGAGEAWQGGDAWKWGTPLDPLNGPHSWPGAWGVDLSDVYSESVLHVLTGTLDLTLVPLTKTVFLQWWEWFEEGSQGSGTPDTASLAINGETVYEIFLDRAAWTEHELDITPYAGQEIELTWSLTTSGSDPTTGYWYVDDVAVHVYAPVAGFEGSWKRVDRTKVAPGGQLTYTFYITNSGHAASTQGYMRDELPAEMFVNAVTLVGQGVVTYGLDFVEWRTTDSAAMGVGQDATIFVVVDVTPTLDCGETFASVTAVAETGGRTEAPLQAPAVSVYPGDVHYVGLFDDDDGGGLASGRVDPYGTAGPGGWEWGQAAPDGYGPAWENQPAHSLPGLWGTYLEGNVPSIAGVYTLTLPALDLSAALSLPLALQWWEWYQADDEDHAGVVWVSSSLAPSPVEVYRVQGEQGVGWYHHSVDLSAFAGHDDVHVQFVYSTDGDEQSGPGWYVDSVMLHDDCPRFLVRPGDQAQTACRGVPAVYRLEMFNWDIVSTPVYLIWDFPWMVEVSPSELTLPPAATEPVTVTVNVPGFGYDPVYPINVKTVIERSPTDIEVVTVRITTTATITAHWQEMAPLPAPRAFHAVVAHGDALYAIGGSSDVTGDLPVSTAYRYDPASDAWSEVAGMPFPLSHIDGAVVNGEIYVPGGQMTGGDYTNTTLVYDPQQDSWRTISASAGELPPAAGYEAVAYDGNLLRLGGYLSSGAATAQVRALDPDSGAWSAMPAMQDPRADFGSGVEGGEIYVAGGLADAVPVTTTEVYDGGSWTYAAAVPTAGSLDRWTHLADAMLDGQFYLIGGERSDATLDHSASYSPTLNAWTIPPDLPPLIQPRRSLGADVVAGAIYAVGGRDATGLHATNERLVFCPICKDLFSVSFDYTWNPDDNPTEPDRIVDGQVVTFTASYEPPTATRPIEFVWNWDDGSPWTYGQEVTHVFTSANPYRATTDDYLVVVTGSNCSGLRLAGDWVAVHSVPLYTSSLDFSPIKDGLPGDTVNHIVNVFNRGTRTDSYNVEVSEDYQWPTTLFLPSDGLIPDLPPGESPGLAWVQVQIPTDTQKGGSDSFTLTVTPHEYPDQFRQIVLTTGYFWMAYLPLLVKAP
jgi:uncharacterized repeat protein (TIGR01451 family)